MSAEAGERRLAAILSADVAGYSRRMAENEAATVAAINAYREQIEMLVRQHRGRLVDFTGDNFLAEFPSATGALDCAVSIQDVLRARNASAAPDGRLEFRIGLHLGEIRAEGGRLFGTGVNTAARLQELAEPGGICLSRSVHEQVRGLGNLAFRDLGERSLKNLPEPVRAYGVVWDRPAAPGPPRPKGAAELPSVAVLPFANMSSVPDQAYFADGMAEELINALTRVDGLRVIARTSAFSFKGTQTDIPTIGRKLGVSTVVEGSVRRAGDRVRIAAQLIDVAGGHHLWSEVYDRSLDDVFAIQDEIARTIVATIRPRLLGEASGPLVKAGTESREAYDLYLRAAERLSLVDRWDTRTAIAMLEDATRLDARYADGWARLGTACCQMEFAFEPDPHWRQQAEQAVARAFELDPDNAEAHAARGRLVWTPHAGFRNREALHELGEALRLQPGNHMALLWRGLILYHVGLIEEGLAHLEEAHSTQPDSPLVAQVMSQALQFQGTSGECMEWMERAFRLDPTNRYAHLWHPYSWICLDDLEGAERALARARQVVGEDALLDASEAILWARRGERSRSESCLARASKDRPSLGHQHHVWHHSAAAHALLDQPHEAVALLRRASETGLPNLPAFTRDPHLVGLRDDPEMKALVADLEREHAEYESEFGRTRAARRTVSS